MTFVRKFNGKTERDGREDRIVCAYTCPEHGEFDAEVSRDERGEAPDAIKCGLTNDWMYTPDGNVPVSNGCQQLATWTPSPTIGTRVRRVEVVRGKWEKPERPTYLDTRKLGEGQDMDEFRAERKRIWERKREAEVMALKKGQL